MILEQDAIVNNFRAELRAKEQNYELKVEEIKSYFEKALSPDRDLILYSINVLGACFITFLLGIVYSFLGTSSNRKKFARNFVLMGGGSAIIITVVKDSFSLSIGMLGALSIIRFRAAIKSPEELSYLFLAISIAVGLGDNKGILVFVGLPIILVMTLLSKSRGSSSETNA